MPSQTPRRRSHLLEWAAVSALLMVLIAWFSAPGQLPRVNHLLQDTLAWLFPSEADPEITIIAIDGRSLEAIGRWPWRRALHAEVLQRVATHQPRAIGLNIVFSDEDLDYPEDDALLAHTLRLGLPVVLPVLRQNDTGHSSAELPLPALTQSAAQLGHVHVPIDDDGIVRSFYRQEGPAGNLWPHFSLAMRCVAGVLLPECRHGALPHAVGHWTRKQRHILRFAHGRSPFRTYSYIDVVRGQVPAHAFRGQYVLIGATSPGLGDLLPAPDGLSVRPIANVELIAHALNNELQDVHLQPASHLLNALVNLTTVALALCAVLWLSPSAALAACLALMLGTLLIAAMIPVWWSVVPAPAAALLGIACAYPLWSWRRLSAATRFLNMELQALQRQGLPTAATTTSRPGDFLNKRIRAVEQASRQLRELHQFISASLQQLPSPTFVCDAQGHILLANAAAERYLHATEEDALQGVSLPELLHHLVDPCTHLPLLCRTRMQNGQLPAQSEGRDTQGRTLLLLAKPFHALQDNGWLLTLVDLTDIRQAQAQRDQAMHFISHDIRAPVASILTLLEMHREYPDQMPLASLLARIERYAHSSLAMAESFVQLASAQSRPYAPEPVDLTALLEEATDDAWARAHEGQVTLTLNTPPTPAYCLGERSMLSRAIANVLGNAIKFSPPHTHVHCTLNARATSWVIAVSDQGPGMDAQQQSQLFTPFQRQHQRSHPGIAGTGLGLAFTHTVMQRHAGRIEVQSTLGAGTEFRLVLPQCAPAHLGDE